MSLSKHRESQLGFEVKVLSLHVSLAPNITKVQCFGTIDLFFPVLEIVNFNLNVGIGVKCIVPPGRAQNKY